MIASAADKERRSFKRRPWLFWGGVLLFVFLLFAARPSLAWWSRRAAAIDLQAGRVGEAQHWIRRAERLDPDSVANQVLFVRSLRHLDERSRWEEAIEHLQQTAADGETLRLEQRLGRLHWGETAPVPYDAWDRLTADGVDSDEAALAVAHGLLRTGDLQRLGQLIEEWESVSDYPQQPTFMRGRLWQRQQKLERAQAALQETLRLEPDHEMAHAALAQLLESQGKFAPALEHYVAWTQRQPDQEQAILGRSRMLRFLGRADEARQVLDRGSSIENTSVPLALEWAQVEYALGNYAEAVRWFHIADLQGPHYASTLRVAATAMALHGESVAAQELFDRVIGSQNRQRRIEELQKRVANDAGDRKAAEALREIQQQPAAATMTEEPEGHPVSRLFSEHCAACHGRDGSGLGPGSRHLYPPARNLREDRYRLVTGTNGQPRLPDIVAVMRNGIPGTAMRAFDGLSDDELQQLAVQVLELRRAGMRDELTEQLRQTGEGVDEGTIERWAGEKLEQARPLEIPEPPALDAPERLAEGRRLYEQAGCIQCHGPDGRGAFDVPLLNDDDSHAIPRDLVAEPMKGGDRPEDLFARLRLGMPGTPHPASPTLDDDALMNLVAYCLSLAAEPKPTRTNWQRALDANRRAIEAKEGG